jgi:hypothetical protein
MVSNKQAKKEIHEKERKKENEVRLDHKSRLLPRFYRMKLDFKRIYYVFMQMSYKENDKNIDFFKKNDQNEKET